MYAQQWEVIVITCESGSRISVLQYGQARTYLIQTTYSIQLAYVDTSRCTLHYDVV